MLGTALVDQVQLLDPAHPFLRLVMAVGVGLIGLEMVRSGRIWVIGLPPY